MKLTENSCIKFTELIASDAPVPGGGGASAYVAAVGVALGDMVGELTVGKKKYADVEEDIKAAMAKAQSLRERFLECVEEDAELFEPLSRAYGIPKDDPTRDTVMEQCLKDAASVPLKIYDLCLEGIELQNEFATKGSKLMISDAATGVMVLYGAMMGAAVNVKVNTKLMKDREYAEKINKHIDETMGKYAGMADEIYKSVYERFE